MEPDSEKLSLLISSPCHPFHCCREGYGACSVKSSDRCSFNLFLMFWKLQLESFCIELGVEKSLVWLHGLLPSLPTLHHIPKRLHMPSSQMYISGCINRWLDLPASSMGIQLSHLHEGWWSDLKSTHVIKWYNLQYMIDIFLTLLCPEFNLWSLISNTDMLVLGLVIGVVPNAGIWF